LMKPIFFKSAQSYEPQTGWKRTSLCNQDAISIEYFVKPPYHASAEHSHDNAQVLVVLKGKMTVKNKDSEVVLSENDCVFIEPNEVHIVTNILNEPSIGIDIFVPGRDFSFWLNKL
jgi:quercetin dioxygenase-like cupin family protein